MAIGARRDRRALEPGLLTYPTVEEGARGVKYSDAALASHHADGAWADCALRL